MAFKTKAQKDTYDKVKAYLYEMFGSDNVNEWGETVFMLSQGSAIVYVDTHAIGDDRAVVNCLCYVVSGANLTPQLMEYLLRENFNMMFGGFSLDKDNDIVFEYAVVGTTIDKEEVRAMVGAVSSTADHYDDEIIKQFGGKTSLQKLQEKMKEAKKEEGLQW